MAFRNVENYSPNATLSQHVYQLGHSKNSQCFKSKKPFKAIPLAAQSKAWVCVLSLGGIAGSNSDGGMYMPVVSVE
jgi:hypothetical protein